VDLDIIDVKPPVSAMTVLDCVVRRGIIYFKTYLICMLEGMVMSVIRASDLS
jgi:hypothetical protein